MTSSSTLPEVRGISSARARVASIRGTIEINALRLLKQPAVSQHVRIAWFAIVRTEFALARHGMPRRFNGKSWHTPKDNDLGEGLRSFGQLLDATAIAHLGHVFKDHFTAFGHW